MQWILFFAAFLHVVFMFCEVFPWANPILLRVASKKLIQTEPFSAGQQELVANIVHNAGIYNGIVAGGLFWAAIGGPQTVPVAQVMLVGAIAAGIFGTITLKSPITALQVVLGIVGFFLV